MDGEYEDEKKGAKVIQKLMCWIFGHKTMYVAFTGQTVEVSHAFFDKDFLTPVNKHARSKHCLRCGKLVHKEE